MSHPGGLPDLFIDRSLGRIQVPNLLRAAGLRLVTLAEHYGIPADEEVADATGSRKSEKRVGGVHEGREHPTERGRARSRKRYSVRCFCLTRQDLTAAEMAERFLRNLAAIEQACSEPGPFIYAVHEKRILRLPLETR